MNDDSSPRLAPAARPRHRFGACLTALALTLLTAPPSGLGCNGKSPEAPLPEAQADPLGDAVQAFAKAQVELARAQVQHGFQCGWHEAFLDAVRRGRTEAPSAFRRDAMGTAFGWGLVFLFLGFFGTFGLAWLLPRFRRRAKPAPRATPPSWPRWFLDVVVHFVKRLGRLLRVDQFDPTFATERQRCAELLRESERQLDVSLHALKVIAVDRPERGAALLTRLSSKRDALVALRRQVDGPGTLPAELSPDHIAPRLDVISRGLRDLRLHLERLAIDRRLDASRPAPSDAATHQAMLDARFTGLERELDEVGDLPHANLPTEVALPGWVRRVGLLGFIALTLSLPMLAAWMAAGAFPLFFAFLFAFGGLTATLLARIHLHRAGRLPLFPGFSDRVARWLTAVCALALTLTLVSSWMSSESGLDLGDPPPVPMPDPKRLEAPALWKTPPARKP